MQRQNDGITHLADHYDRQLIDSRRLRAIGLIQLTRGSRFFIDINESLVPEGTRQLYLITSTEPDSASNT